MQAVHSVGNKDHGDRIGADLDASRRYGTESVPHSHLRPRHELVKQLQITRAYASSDDIWAPGAIQLQVFSRSSFWIRLLTFGSMQEARLEEHKKIIDQKDSLRRSNLNPERPDANYLRTLDSSIKRNTTVIKKLKTINDEQKDGLMDELKIVNLSKFVSEAVSYICEAKLRSADIQAAVQVCSLLHQRYKDFSPCLIQGLLKVFFPGKAGDDLDADKNSRAMKKRSTLKLLIELYFVGIVEDASIFVNIIKDLTSAEHLKDREATQTNLSLLSAFARQGRFFVGLQSQGQEAYDEFYKEMNVTADQKKFFKKALNSYYDAVSELLQSEHTSLRLMEAENAKVLSAKGELSDESTASYEKLRKSFDQLLRGVSSLAESLDMQPPVMPDDENTTRVTTGTEVSPSSGKESSALEPIWDDEDTKSFYESLPDLRAFVPAVLLGEVEPKSNEQHAKGREQSSEPAAEQETEVHDSVQSSSTTEPQPEVKTDDGVRDNDDKDKGKDGEKEKSKDKDLDKKPEREKEKVRALDSASLDNLLQRLPGCVSRDLIDQLTDQINIETKIKNIRFIGELCKFKMAPPALVFSCLKACLDDFSHHNIDVACNLLETCGRFLYRSPETTIRMANMLEILMRLKNVKNLDPRHSTLVENAYYLCKPPERSARVAKVRPPLHQYIRKLLFSDLDKSSVEHVLRQLRKLPWAECQQYLLKCFLKVHKGKYSQVHLIALLTASLSRYHDDFAVAVVDEVLEEIRVGLELHDYGMQQRRLAHMRFLGELYSYKHIDSSVVFETLYLIIVFGHGTPETCGHYFSKGSSKRKLDKFLLHFQRYIISKGPLPLDIEFDIQDLFAELRPNMSRYSSIEELNAAIVELEEKERAAPVEKAESERHSDSESHKRQPRGAALSVNGQTPANGVEENGKDHEAAGSESYSDSGSVDGREDEEDLSEEKSNDGSDNEGDDEDDDIPVGSDEDEGVEIRQKVVQIDPKEQEDFDRELKALLQESLESRKSEARSRLTLNMMVPMNVLEGSKDPRAIESESGEETVDEEGGNVRVKVLMKKGHKQQTKQMLIPADSSLVQSTKQQEAAELEEKQSIKRRILEYNEREEEELNGGASQIGTWGQGGSNTSSIRSGGRGNWDGSMRGGGRQRHHIAGAGGFYHSYGRRR
ncbi:hypothetical protein PR202_ga02060 [Eleusine coracana subsp. coracana]|uniref:MIF4G domain-containing protein n=1 Tax=Eleusine coracana subsp. coracana TaxID=191504 RepID=A0AAV5BIQ2_ELECO|nr:hypothetical protein PR202_ga01373 [Eleusine coracana subsp. coracana]GJM86222.1 hypothetical protein PR202_ga02060 [Eleusine coracana subsp. coracana]